MLAGEVQPAAAVEQVGIAVVGRPGVGVVEETLGDEQAGAVGVDPASQGGPGVQQRLVGDLHGGFVEGEQAYLVGGEGVQHRPGPGRVVINQFRAAAAPAGVVSTLGAEGDQT